MSRLPGWLGSSLVGRVALSRKAAQSAEEWNRLSDRQEAEGRLSGAATGAYMLTEWHISARLRHWLSSSSLLS